MLLPLPSTCMLPARRVREQRACLPAALVPRRLSSSEGTSSNTVCISGSQRLGILNHFCKC